MSKNILFFFSTTTVGGAETNILKISKELTKQGTKVFWCFLVNDGPLLDRVDFELSGYQELGLYYKNPVGFFKRYKTFVQQNKIDVVLNFGLRVEIISRLISKKIGIDRIISNIRSTDDWRKWYHVFLDRITSSPVDLWVSNSKAAKEIFHEREKIPLDKIVVIYNFYEQIVNEKHNHKLLDKNDVIKIGILANITKEKGYFDMLKLSQRLNEENIKHTFYYAGVDKLNGAFEEGITQNSLKDNFKYLGYISDKALFFSEIDVFLLPSYLEGMPTAVLEAMAYEKNIISTDVGGIPELITDGENGYLCKPGDVDCYLSSIHKVINCTTSFSIANRKKLEEFSKENIMAEWRRVILS